MPKEPWDLIEEAYTAVASGLRRIDVSDRISVYQCGSVIRIDIKEE